MAVFPSFREFSDFIRGFPKMVVQLPGIVDRFDDLAADIERVAVAAEALAQATEPVRSAQDAFLDAQSRIEEGLDNVADRVRRGRAAAADLRSAVARPRRPRKPDNKSGG